MSLVAEQKELIYKNIVDIILEAIRVKDIESFELSNIAEFSLKRIKELQNENDTHLFYQELAERWPVFELLLEEEQGKISKQTEGEVSEGVLTLLHHGKIDDALSLAKTATTT